MQYRLIRLLIIFSWIVFFGLLKIQPVFAATYYVDSSAGTDSNAGTSTNLPWRTLTKVNSMNLSGGDTVSFRRGGSWTGMLQVNNSGQSGNPITFNSYGSGTAPVLSNPCAGCYSDIIQIYGTHIVVRDLLLQDAHQAAIHLKPGSGNIVISDNEITRVGYGVLVQTSNNTITRNRVHDLTMVVNNTSNPDDDYGANGFWLQTADNNEISYNSCINCRAPSYDYGTDGGFVEFWTGNNNNRIHHNWVENTNGFIEVGGNGSGQTVSNNTISYNVSVNNLGFGCLHTDGNFRAPIENLRIEHNTIVNMNVEGYRLLDCITPSPSMLSFRNNIVYSPIQIASSGDFTRSNNLYYLTNGAALGYSLGSGEKMGNPLFINQNGKDFHLQAGSPARDAGVNLGYSLDYDNVQVPSGSAPDIGAFESGGTVVITPTPTTIPTSTPGFTPTPRPPTPTPGPTLSPAPGSTLIQIFAAGRPAGGIYPTMQLLINDMVVATWTGVAGDPTNRVFQTYSYFAPTLSFADTVKVAFTNDTLVGTEDSNLYVDKIMIGSSVYETESAQVYSEGSYSTDTGCGAGYKQSETLHCNGFFLYAQSVSATPTPSPTTKLGDGNADNKVDGIDYVIWLNNFGITTSSGPTKGDYNKDTKVDGIDYVMWLNNFGK